MDILSHSLSGVAFGTVIASFAGKGFKQKTGIVLLSGLGGALPDIDAISLWSRFDTTIGHFFGLAHSGNEIYFSKFWYSHHGAMHSLLVAGIVTSIIGILLSLFSYQREKGLLDTIKRNGWLLTGFMGGYLLHLLEDMPTPSSVWGGVNFFWPSKDYIGGAGNIWWWNNYDIFLIILSVIVINSILLFLPRYSKQTTISVFIIGCGLALFQMKSRPVDFSYTGHTTQYARLEQRSKEIQKEILGEKVYQIMVRFDNSIGLNF